MPAVGFAQGDPFVADPPPPPPDGYQVPVVVQQGQTGVVVIEQQQQQQQPVLVMQQQPGPMVRPARRLPYTEGMLVPPGYTLVERSRPGLWIPGLIMVVVPWAIGASAASVDDRLSGLYVPVIGPFLVLGEVADAARGPLIFMGVVEVAGFAMFLGGLLGKRRYLAYTGSLEGRHLGFDLTPNGVRLEGRF